MLKKRTAVLLFIVGLLAWSTAIYGRLNQPVKFNHNKHVVENEMECTDCHRYVNTNRKATLPGKEVCLECHSEALGESPEEQKLIAILDSDQALKWRRIYALPKHVYFSHFRHVTLGQISCQNCHGDMDQLTSPPRRPAVDIIDMEHCMSCHEARHVSNDCLGCHF
jgi:predicted CXXCH cytochrome family protein